MSQVWNSLLIQPLLNTLVFFYKSTGNLGIAIILLTILLRFLMTPLILPSLKLSKKMQEMAPELSKLKEKFKNDKQGLIAAQAELYRQHQINPASGCLPQIIQLLVLIALFSVLNSILKPASADLISSLNSNLYSFNLLPNDFLINTGFLYLDLSKPDTFFIPGIPLPLPGIFLILSALAQLASSLMMSPQKIQKKEVSAQPATEDAMVEAQKQMTYLFPLMTLVIGYQFPAGLVIYWTIFSFYSAIQQYFISGWGGLTPWLKKLNLLKSPSHG